ncbi:MAG: phosphatidate cytidylyltransferase [Actinomycetota bacterium]|nr:phosphatidate cytidylyltransferase [Actinomycetota bacterium]
MITSIESDALAASKEGLGNLARRALTAAIGIPLIVAVVMAGKIAFAVALIAAAIIGINESLRLAGKISPAPVFRLTSIAYVALPMFFLGLLYLLDSGPIWVIFTFVATWLADTSAYTVGRLVGRRPLAPTISPNKTIEGAVGGLTVTSLVFAALTFLPVLSLPQRILFGLTLAVAATAGDLFESVFKRRAGVKDSGTILPGHGGFLDRIDSLLFTAPISYLLLRLWI